MLCVGTAVAVTVPSVLVTKYQCQPEVFYKVADQSKGKGTAFNLSVCENSYYFAQVILAIFAGQIVDLAKDNRLYMVISSVSGMISAILSLGLTYDAPDEMDHQNSEEEGTTLITDQ